MHGCQNCILHVRRNNSRKIWCWGKNYCFITYEFLSKCVRIFCEKVGHGGQNCIPRPQMILPRKKNKSLEQHINFFNFLRIRTSNLRRLVETSCTVVKTAFYMYEGTIQEKFDVGEKTLLFLSLLFFNQNIFGVFAEKFRHGVQNCFSPLQMILPRKKNKTLG